MRDMLEKHRREATDMLLTEYDEELHIKNEKAISYEDGMKVGWEGGMKEGWEGGMKEGWEGGKKEGWNLLARVIHLLKEGKTDDEILREGIDKEMLELAKTCL